MCSPESSHALAAQGQQQQSLFHLMLLCIAIPSAADRTARHGVFCPRSRSQCCSITLYSREAALRALWYDVPSIAQAHGQSLPLQKFVLLYRAVKGAPRSNQSQLQGSFQIR